MKIFIVGDNDIDKNKYIQKLKTGQIHNYASTELFQINRFKYKGTAAEGNNTYQLINVSSAYNIISDSYHDIRFADALIIMLPSTYISSDNLLYWYNLVDDIPIVVIRDHCGNDSIGRRLKKLSDKLAIQYRDICLDIDSIDTLAEPLEYLL